MGGGATVSGDSNLKGKPREKRLLEAMAEAVLYLMDVHPIDSPGQQATNEAYKRHEDIRREVQEAKEEL